ncbi:MAG: class I SAM-dependent methyltransferase [Dehalococcoidia bacterium]
MSELPADFLAQIQSLEQAYLASDDPIRQSGFGGGAERWRREREPVLDAIDGDGDLLDIGCANGYLAVCLVEWGAERGLRMTPHGIDIGPLLIAEAKGRLPAFAANFQVANGWDWRPDRRFRYVYTLWDCVPPELLGEYARRLLSRVVEPGGRLIVGAYGSRSRETPPAPIGDLLESHGLTVAGRAYGGDPVITAFAWTDN